MEDVNDLAYHRKYRPNTLAKYVGNDKLKETALKALASGKRPQVILLWGDSGCGKTTFARLLAKEYSCEDRDDEKGACGVCSSCAMIDDYIATGSTDTLTNIQEINIADQSGKRDLDSVLDDMMIPAFGDEWKIYIFDECHEASSGLQNKMLKIAEEPPEHVLMMFCTTNPEKMIDTLKNRCQLQLHVTKPKVKELAGLLRYVCETEGVEYDDKGLEFIANRGGLTIRTALMHLGQVVTEQNSAKYEKAIKVFEAVSGSLMIDFFKALKNKDVFRYVTILYEIQSRMNLSVFLDELQNFVKRGVYTINGIQVEGVSDGEFKTYRDLFGNLGVAQISNLLIKILGLNRNNLEMELLMLGYSGFDTVVQQEKKAEVYDIPVAEIASELKGEAAIAGVVLKEKADNEYEQGVENSKSVVHNVDISELLGAGATLIN